MDTDRSHSAVRLDTLRPSQGSQGYIGVIVENYRDHPPGSNVQS